MKKLVLIFAFIFAVQSYVYAQEFGATSKVEPYSFEDFNQEYQYLLLENQRHVPSLSNLQNPIPDALSKITIRELNLHDDLRKKAFRNKTPLVMVTRRKQNPQNYTIKFAQKKKEKSFSVNISNDASQNNSALYGSRSNRVRNSVYQESRSGFVNPFTGTYYYFGN